MFIYPRGVILSMDVSDLSFKHEVLEQSKAIPVLVDFWSPTCPPCMMLKPILEKLEQEFEGKFVLVKARVDQAMDAARQYEVQGIPAVKLFKDGEVVAEFVGAMPEFQVKEWLEQNV